SAATTNWHAPEQIAAVAEDFLQQKIGSSAGRTNARAQPLDPRHRLAQCSKPLKPFMRQGTKISARTIVGVECTGTKPWKLYVPVNVIVTDSVLVAKRTLPRGSVLSADDFMSEQRDVSRLLRGYLSDSKALVGQKLKTQMLAGSILTPAMVQANVAIRRGQTVTLTIASSGVSIQMSGKAMMDGALSQRIRVENMNSGRIVEGIVRSREHVEIIVPPTSNFFNATPKVSPKVADMRSSNNDR
ncbi:MAG: flagellar basal body P-ring formation chaperone FlgA, partial [Gammaproteobacteria bacterium]